LTPIERLKTLLPIRKRNQKLLHIICKHYSSRLLTVANEELAVELYAIAERSLGTETRAFSRTMDFIVDGVFERTYSSKATFYLAFDCGKPVVVKYTTVRTALIMQITKVQFCTKSPQN